MISLLKWIPRRRVLVGIFGLTVLVDGLLVAYWIRPPLVTVEADFTIGAQHVSSTTALQQLPTFDRLRDRWMIGNREVKDVRRYLMDPDPQRIERGSLGSFFPMRLPDGGGLETLRRAVNQLATSGICQIAIFDIQSRLESMATILRVRRYRNQAGKWETCEDTVNPTPYVVD
ncbi:hypothetical protein MOK15_15295 [Sphingobium sp. BYY-5]|uniref:hypothetical protein n=1 Tax=Sphingobium sp. BYY-5 TaxID=2926400 RepID=UPI001FA72455|nr:hypothetical protein [Sphingobium sp. BYY-5]MCI4591252.1 hypothetical protein [Sphingobium sp. BYY-5]MCI4591450.1 hypothetical protein [Sphingobium sp. BYY-5]